jgi:hypothetical protein
MVVQLDTKNVLQEIGDAKLWFSRHLLAPSLLGTLYNKNWTPSTKALSGNDQGPVS